MADTFKLTITTPEATVLEKEVSFVKLPAQGGEVGVLPGHSSSILKLGFGALVVKETEENQTPYFVKEGFAHITPDSVTLLVPFIEDVSSIDKKRAEDAKERAEKRLSSRDEGEIDRSRARLSRLRAEERLHLLA